MQLHVSVKEQLAFIMVPYGEDDGGMDIFCWYNQLPNQSLVLTVKLSEWTSSQSLIVVYMVSMTFSTYSWIMVV